jgi:tetratricopeptide (TPR) repeat protein
MGKLAADFPDDNEIAVLYAEALMDLSPWNYWQPGGHEPNPQSAAIVPTLERVLVNDPSHPGAIHFYIHAVEATDRPERAEPFADRLRGAIPNAGHLQAGRLAEAEDQFQRALKRAPANGWSYYGLLQLHKSRGDAKAAAQAEAELAKTWVGDRQLLQISNR